MKINAFLLTIALLAIGAMANANGSQVSVGSLATSSKSTVGTPAMGEHDGGGHDGDGGHDRDGGHDGDGGHGGQPQCTPEPFSMVGLGMATLGILRARAKKKA